MLFRRKSKTRISPKAITIVSRLMKLFVQFSEFSKLIFCVPITCALCAVTEERQLRALAASLQLTILSHLVAPPNPLRPPSSPVATTRTYENGLGEHFGICTHFKVEECKLCKQSPTDNSLPSGPLSKPPLAPLPLAPPGHY